MVDETALALFLRELKDTDVYSSLSSEQDKEKYRNVAKRIISFLSSPNNPNRPLELKNDESKKRFLEAIKKQSPKEMSGTIEGLLRVILYEKEKKLKEGLALSKILEQLGIHDNKHIKEFRNRESHYNDSFSMKEAMEITHNIYLLLCDVFLHHFPEKIAIIDIPEYEEVLEELKKHNERWRNKYVEVDVDEFCPAVVHINTNQHEPILEALEHNKYAICFGEAGSGKSTTLEYLTYIYSDKILRNIEAPFPIFVELKHLGLSLIDLVKESLNIDGEDTHIKKIQDLKQYKCILLLDGYNEISRQQQQHVDGEIRKLIQNDKQSECKIILTSRPSSRLKFKKIEARYMLQPFTDEQIKKYLNKNCENYSVKLHNELQKKTKLYNWVRNPFYLHLFSSLIQKKGRFPESRGHLLQEFFREKLFTEKDKKKHDDIDVDFWLHLLYELAYRTRIEQQVSFSFDKIMAIVGEKATFLRGKAFDSVAFIEHLVDISILCKQDGKYSFGHEMYQEYFCSEYMLKNESIREMINKQMFKDPFLKGPLLISLGLISEQQFEKLLTSLHPDTVEANIILFAQRITQEKFSDNTDDRIVVQKAQELWAKRRKEARKKALLALATLHRREDISNLFKNDFKVKKPNQSEQVVLKEVMKDNDIQPQQALSILEGLIPKSKKNKKWMEFAIQQLPNHTFTSHNEESKRRVNNIAENLWQNEFYMMIVDLGKCFSNIGGETYISNVKDMLKKLLQKKTRISLTEGIALLEQYKYNIQEYKSFFDGLINIKNSESYKVLKRNLKAFSELYDLESIISTFLSGNSPFAIQQAEMMIEKHSKQEVFPPEKVYEAKKSFITSRLNQSFTERKKAAAYAIQVQNIERPLQKRIIDSFLDILGEKHTSISLNLAEDYVSIFELQKDYTSRVIRDKKVKVVKELLEKPFVWTYRLAQSIINEHSLARSLNSNKVDDILYKVGTIFSLEQIKNKSRFSDVQTKIDEQKKEIQEIAKDLRKVRKQTGINERTIINLLQNDQASDVAKIMKDPILRNQFSRIKRKGNVFVKVFQKKDFPCLADVDPAGLNDIAMTTCIDKELQPTRGDQVSFFLVEDKYGRKKPRAIYYKDV